MREDLKKLALVSLPVFLATLLVADRLAGLAGLPDETGESLDQVAHPSNYSRLKENLEYSYLFQTNSQGLRYPEIPLHKPAGEVRVLVLGDSFVEGEGVRAEATFEALMEKSFSRGGKTVRFINMGLAGTGPYEYGRVLSRIGYRYEPDLVLLMFYANDVTNTRAGYRPGQIYEDLSAERGPAKRALHALLPRTYTLYKKARAGYRARRRAQEHFVETVEAEARRRHLPEADILRWEKSLPPAWVDAVDHGRFNGSLLSNGLLNPSYWTDALDIDTPEAERKWEATAAILKDISHEVHDHHLPLALVYAPSRFQYESGVYEDLAHDPWTMTGAVIRKDWLKREAPVEGRLKHLAEEERLPFLDLTPVFRAADRKAKDLVIKLDGHWSESGQKVAAVAIGRWLLRAGLLSGR